MATESPTIIQISESSFDLGIDMINIYAGPESNRKYFKIHKSLLLQRLPLFSASHNLDSNDKLTLPDIDSTVFTLLQKWLYGPSTSLSRTPLSPKQPTRYTTEEAFIALDKTHTSTIKLFGLAESLSEIELMDDAITAIIQGVACGIGSPVIDIPLVYKLTTPSSKLRELMVRCFAELLLNSGSEDGIVSLPFDIEAEENEDLKELMRVKDSVPEFGRDLWGVLGSLGPLPKPPGAIYLCHYHGHEWGVGKWKGKRRGCEGVLCGEEAEILAWLEEMEREVVSDEIIREETIRKAWARAECHGCRGKSISYFGNEGETEGEEVENGQDDVDIANIEEESKDGKDNIVVVEVEEKMKEMDVKEVEEIEKK